MYHSITFSNDLDSTVTGRLVGKNTWDDWHLIPSSRPSVAQAGVSTNFVDIPGRSTGPIDMTEYLTGSVVYGQRKGSFEFIVDNDHESWVTLQNKIVNYIHGKRLRMSLEDDPTHYYEGRFTVSDWKSESWNSKITINYVLDPKRQTVA